uniref:Sorting nexin-3 n=2 Tax=Phlebotominae TaxID=7198 RepID=A0A1B0GHA0_LUTLO
MMVEDSTASEATRRLNVKKQTLDDAYAVPANFLEIDVVNPMTSMTAGKKRYTDYEVRMRTNLPVFKVKESSVRRRYSDFEWLRNELERDSKIVVPPLPGKAWKRQMPFRGDDGLFDENFIEERRKGLEIFINKIAGHPLAQNERINTNLPVFKVKESSVRRRYSDFEWLRNELERDSKIVVPPLPGKAWKRQMPFRGDDGLFDENFIEERRKGLEIFINKIAGHPLAQNERCLHMFLQEPTIDKNYVPGKIRNT